MDLAFSRQLSLFSNPSPQRFAAEFRQFIGEEFARECPQRG
jgi:hypothetical protein